MHDLFGMVMFELLVYVDYTNWSFALEFGENMASSRLGAFFLSSGVRLSRFFFCVVGRGVLGILMVWFIVMIDF